MFLLFRPVDMTYLMVENPNDLIAHHGGPGCDESGKRLVGVFSSEIDKRSPQRATIRWGATRFVVVDYVGLDAVIAREVGKRKLERIPVRVANPDRTPGDRAAWTPISSPYRKGPGREL